MKKLDKTLQDALLASNLLGDEELKGFLEEILITEESLRAYLIRNAIVTEKQIIIALSQYLDVPIVDLKNQRTDQEIIDKVPIKFAWYYKILPVTFKDEVLTLACYQPFDVKVQDEIRMNLGVPVEFALATETQLLEALKKHYGFASDTIDRIMTKEPGKVTAADDGSGQWIEDLETQTDNPTVSNLVNQIILEAYKKRATDIHIEPYRDNVRVRYRIDGVLVDANMPENVKHFLSPILSRIKILANLSITEKRLPQDGSAVVKTKDQQLDLRISTIPTPRGESMVIRILPTKVILFSLEKLGFDANSLQQFSYLIKKPHGIIFITGPTGSGKTTTLYACLNEINAAERKIITIEDPVEYEMKGITQVQVNPKVNFTFSTGLRSILRHDPDIIMVGEVRDPETAEIAIKTALTGHLVFSTLHTNDASSGITRLIDMGTEAYLVASSVVAFVAQRLVRVICPKCKEIDPQPIPGIQEEIAHALKIPSAADIKIYKGRGCDECNQTGFFGRVAIYEILILNDTIRAAMIEKPRADYIKRIAMREGLVTLRQNGWKTVVNGITTPEEVLNVTVKDEEIDEILKREEQQPPKGKYADAMSLINDFRLNKVQPKDFLKPSKKQIERIYPRTANPIKVVFKRVQKNPQNPNEVTYEKNDYSASSWNLSAGGVLFVTDELLPLGTIIELKIHLQEASEVITCLGKVCRVEEQKGDTEYLIAAYYLDITSADRVRINRFIEKQLNENGRS